MPSALQKGYVFPQSPGKSYYPYFTDDTQDLDRLCNLAKSHSQDSTPELSLRTSPIYHTTQPIFSHTSHYGGMGKPPNPILASPATPGTPLSHHLDQLFHTGPIAVFRRGAV